MDLLFRRIAYPAPAEAEEQFHVLKSLDILYSSASRWSPLCNGHTDTPCQTKITNFILDTSKILLLKIRVFPVHAIKECRGSKGTAPFILNFGIWRSWLVNFTLLPLYPCEENHGTHWTGGRVGPRPGLDVLEKIKSPVPDNLANTRSEPQILQSAV